jgi:ankyrin repeat protein
MYPKEYKVTYYKRSMLIHAVEFSCIAPRAHIELLIRASDVNEGDRSGWTALHAACWYGNLDIVRSLLRHNANVNVATHSGDGTTPLMSACYHPTTNEHMDVIRTLIEHNADVNAVRMDDGWTALMLANHPAAVDILLTAGADRFAVDIDGQTAQDHWRSSGYDYA